MQADNRRLAVIATQDEERATVQQLEQLLTEAGTQPLSLSDAEGGRVPVPAPIVRLLSEAAHQLAQGKRVILLSAGHDLSTSGAAALLGVSRPYLVRLLDRGDLAFHRVGSHRRIRLDDLLAYRHVRQRQREDALDELTALSDEYGLYDAGVAPAHT